jgi:putative FmdB family regulatory protein
MPIYVKKCKKCGYEFDFYKLRESSRPICPKCKNEEAFEDIPTAAAIHFKGEGWTSPNHVSMVDPTSVPGVKKVENPTKRDRTLYKFPKKQPTGARKKIRVPGLKEVPRRKK